MKFTVPLKSRLAHGVSFDILVLCGVEVYVFSRTTAIDSNRWMSKSETSEPAKKSKRTSALPLKKIIIIII